MLNRKEQIQVERNNGEIGKKEYNSRMEEENNAIAKVDLAILNEKKNIEDKNKLYIEQNKGKAVYFNIENSEITSENLLKSSLLRIDISKIDKSKITDLDPGIYNAITNTENEKAKQFMQNNNAVFYEFTIYSISSETFFETNSSTLSKEGENMLSAIYDVISHRTDLPVVISGHTDNIGDETSNIELSQNRAKSVANFLVNKGLSENKIKSINGFGSSKPFSTNSTSDGRAKNRRVEIKQVKN